MLTKTTLLGPMRRCRVSSTSLTCSKGQYKTYQASQEFSPDVDSLVVVDITKLKEAKFIGEVQHPEWLNNVAPMKKKNDQLYICVDFWDHNKVCPKMMPSHYLSQIFCLTMFLDSFNRYNQIRMAPEDEETMTFYTPIGIFYYSTPFGLKNVSATYHRAM